MIQIEQLHRSVTEFEEKEGRTNFFSLARKLIEAGFEIEGLLLILSTWNFAKFRFAVKEFDINKFQETIQRLKPKFDRFDTLDFTIINFTSFQGDIKAIYTALSMIKGVEHTGAPKLMHLKSPKVFVMWDSYIRGEKPKKYYQELEIVKNGTWECKKYEKNADGYIRFLKDMQTKFGKLNFTHPTKTLAKAIDEFNYVHITLPMQEMEKQKRKSKI